MRKINWAELIVRPMFRKAQGMENPFFETKRVKEMSFAEAIKVRSLGGWGRAYGIMSVYADIKFNSDYNNTRMWGGQQENIISTIYSSKSKYNFKKACSAFCGIRATDVDINSGVIEKVVRTVADAEQDFQAEYASRAACSFTKFKDYPHIVSYLSHAQNEAEAKKAYGQFYELMITEYDEEKIAKEVRNIMRTSSKNMMMEINDSVNDEKSTSTDRSAVVEFIDEMPCYSRGTERPKIKIKSIRTLPHTSGARPKVER